MAIAVSGRVVLEKAGVGIPGVLVVVHDVAPPPATGARTEGGPRTERSAAATATNASVRLGSRVTSATGAFDIKLADESAKRAHLRLQVLAPEGPGARGEARVLYESSDVRVSAGHEEYLVRLPAADLENAGIPVPLDPSVAKEEPQRLLRKLNQAVADRVQIDDEARNIASKRVQSIRERAARTDEIVESRVIESLTGLTAAKAEKLRVVLPGMDAEPLIWKTANGSIAKVNDHGSVAGYIVVSADDAERFKDSNGNYRHDLTPTEVEPFLYDRTEQTGGASVLVRNDPAECECRASASSEDPFAASGHGANGAGSNGGSPSGEPATGPVAAEDLPRLLGNLVQPILAPEDASIFRPQSRPDASAVQGSVQALELRSGPADVPAFYDFHQLQIAFDYVWQHAVDEGILQTAKTLARQLDEDGGDPIAALRRAKDPIRALREEARYVTAAQSTLRSSGVAYRRAGDNAVNGTAVPEGGVPPGPGPKPAKIHNTFVDDVRATNVQGEFTVAPQQPHELLQDLEELLNERYKFEIFAPGSTNFGLVVTYRQKWVPLNYQVGQLLKTLTLAPKETRKVSTKRVVKRERSVKELQENQRIRKDELNQTMRDEAEIVSKAQDKTTFSLSAKGSFNVGAGSGEVTTSYGRDAEKSSQDVKKSFREAVMKAAQEYKDERKLEVETKESLEEETSESAEVTNPNDELTVTYLFYELQRRFRVSESLHRLTPVVLVGMEMPNPNRHAVDRILLAHSWVINRVLLDDRYRPALDYLCSRIVGKELELQHLAVNVAEMRAAVQKLEQMQKEIADVLVLRETQLQEAMMKRAKRLDEATHHWYEAILGDGEQKDFEAAKVREDAAREAYDREVRHEKDLRMRLDSETASLSNAIETYAKAYSEHCSRLLEVAALRAHFKENVLYYMQAIWSHTFHDQTFFTLASLKVPKLAAAHKTYAVAVPDEIPIGIVSQPGQVVLEVTAEVELETDLDPENDYQTLAEIADLDQPLGFKGNYMIFPLKQSNALTDFMMTPYIDTALGLRDPDDLGNWTPEDFVRYAKCLKRRLADELSDGDMAALTAELAEKYRKILSNPHLASDEIVIPTTSLYIEALPGAHPLLEDFKLAHRVIDVKKAQAETRKIEIENLRYAARILQQALEDPEIDKKIIVTGTGDNLVVTPSDT